MNVILAGWKELDWDAPRLTEEVQPDYVVLTLPVGKTHQETRKRHKNTPQENNLRKQSKKELRREQIIDFCSEPKSSSEILAMLGLTAKKNLMEVYITPMITEGLLSMTEPDNPTSKNQMYVANNTEKS